MSIVVDKNLVVNNSLDSEYDWYDVNNGKFDIYGVAYDGDMLTARIPNSIAKTISEGVEKLSKLGAGGRIRFSTDSKTIAIKADFRMFSASVKTTTVVESGFDLYVSYRDKSEIYLHTYIPEKKELEPGIYSFTYTLEDNLFIYDTDKSFFDFTLYLPCFTSINKMEIGLCKNSTLKNGIKYVNDKPIVFYGSSITNGACASRPGTTYESVISQRYNYDFVNLGFAGSAKGEAEMAKYISDLDMSVFVCDYDHNAPSVEHLKATYTDFYNIIREKHPQIPFIMVSKPDVYLYPTAYSARRDYIYEFYKKVKENGDDNAYFVDGYKLFGDDFPENCTVDGCHPTDVGFYRMADAIGKVIHNSITK